MDRFSTRLAASLIEDRHREAVATRRYLDAALTRSDPTSAPGLTGAAALERALRALPRPIRIRTAR